VGCGGDLEQDRHHRVLVRLYDGQQARGGAQVVGKHGAVGGARHEKRAQVVGAKCVRVGVLRRV